MSSPVTTRAAAGLAGSAAHAAPAATASASIAQGPEAGVFLTRPV